MSTQHRRDARPEDEHHNPVRTAPKKGGLVSTFYTAQKALRHLAEIKDVVRDGTLYAGEHVSIPQALEWLLDNWYIAEREGKSAADNLKRLGRLPRCGADGKALFVLYAAHEYLDAQNDAADADSLEAFLDGFQEETVLNEAELAAMIPAVRLALIERLAGEAADLREALSAARRRISQSLPGRFHASSRRFGFSPGLTAQTCLSASGASSACAARPAGVYPRWTSQRATTTAGRLRALPKSTV